MGGIVPQSQSKMDPCSPEKVKQLVQAKLDMAAAINKGIAGLANVAYDPKGAVEENAFNKTPTDIGQVFCKYMDNQAGKGTQVYTKDNDQESKPGEVPVPKVNVEK